MGYTTEFRGAFTVDPPMSVDLFQAINAWRELRHGGNCDPFEGCPSLYCQWVATSATTIEWDEGEKFYGYVEWLRYIIEHFLAPNGHTLSGTVEWCGEDRFDDRGNIVVQNNVVQKLPA